MPGYPIGGVFDVPAGGGDVFVPVPGDLQSVIFMGTNFTTEDSIISPTALGLFRGMIAPKYDDPGTMYQNAASAAVDAGDAHAEDDYAILMIDTAGLGAILYRATVTLDTGGFTASFDTGASGYKVVYMALINYDNMAAIRSGSTTVNLGFKAESSLLHGAWLGPVISGTDRVQECWGGGAYPGSSSGSWKGAYVTDFVFPTSSGQQFFIFHDAPSGGTVGFGGHFTGPFLITGAWTAVPTGAGLEDFSVSFDSGNNAGMTTIWDGESDAGFVVPAQATAGTATVTGLDFAPGAVITYSLSAQNGGQSSGGTAGSVGLSLTTPDFHWCAIVDNAQGAFQSFQRDWVDVIQTATIHAGTMELTDDGFIVTTEEDSATRSDLVWHAFGYPRPRALWVPQIYRRRVAA